MTEVTKETLDSFIKSHQLAVEHLSEYGGLYYDNLMYSRLFIDSPQHYYNRVCWANLMSAGYFTDDDPAWFDVTCLKDGTYITDGAIFGGERPSTHLCIHPYGQHLRKQKATEDYHFALRAWCQLYSAFVVNSNSIVEDGYILVDTRNADVDCLGAFLVGFRNLHEQGYYKQFKALLEAKIPLHQAAYFMNIVTAANEWGHHGHNIIHTPPTHWSVAQLVEMSRTCKLFDVQQMLVTNQQSDDGVQFPWKLTKHFFTQPVAKSEVLKTELVEVGVVSEREKAWGGTYYTPDFQKFVTYLKGVL